nr:hypothetical protein [Tanacetum cinerariifolium]
MTTLTEHIIVAGVENRSLIVEKSMYDSWASRIRLFIKGKKHGRMVLDSIYNGPLVYLTVEEKRQTRSMKYSKPTEAQQLQDDCDVQATNIILHVLPPNFYALVNHQEAAKDIWDRVKLLILDVPMFQQGKDQIECINKAMEFLSAVASRQSLRNSAFQTKDMDAYDSNYDDLSLTKVVMMENISSCDPEALSEESQDAVIQDTNSFAPNDLLLLSLVEQMTDHVAHLDKENQISKMIN